MLAARFFTRFKTAHKLVGVVEERIEGQLGAPD
jgi:hypothetical protein